MSELDVNSLCLLAQVAENLLHNDNDVIQQYLQDLISSYMGDPKYPFIVLSESEARYIKDLKKHESCPNWTKVFVSDLKHLTVYKIDPHLLTIAVGLDKKQFPEQFEENTWMLFPTISDVDATGRYGLIKKLDTLYYMQQTENRAIKKEST